MREEAATTPGTRVGGLTAGGGRKEPPRSLQRGAALLTPPDLREISLLFLLSPQLCRTCLSRPRKQIRLPVRKEKPFVLKTNNFTATELYLQLI